MEKNRRSSRPILLVVLGLYVILLFANSGKILADENLDKLVFVPGPDIGSGLSVDYFSLHGYTTYWEEFYGKRYLYAGLFAGSIREPKNEILELEDKIGQQLLLEELWMQKSFIHKLAKSKATILVAPTSAEVNSAIADKNFFIVCTDRDSVMEKLLNKIPEELRFRRNRAFYLEDGHHTLFVISSHTKEEANKLKNLVEKAVEFTRKYKMYKGITGYQTNYFSLSSLEGNPIDIIAKALNLRCSWIFVSGYNDWMVPGLVRDWLSRINFKYIFEPGQYGKNCVMYGMKEYPPVQDNTLETCLEWTKKHHGYIFGNLSLADEKKYDFDGYLIDQGDQKKIKKIGKPFITEGRGLTKDIPPTMVVFLDKDLQLNKENIFKAILDKKCVAIFPDGDMIGPREYIESLWMLALDRIYLEHQFSERADISAKVEKENLIVSIKNRQGKILNGDLLFDIPQELTLGENVRWMPVSLGAWEQRTIELPISYTNKAAGKINPIALTLDWSENRYTTITHLDIPHPIEIHRLLLVDEDKFSFPITVWNCSKNGKVNVKIDIFSTKNALQPVLSKNISVAAHHARETIYKQDFLLKEGEYTIKVSALDYVAEGRISVKKCSGEVTTYLEDLNDDGIDEIVMENSQIRTTILLTGGRVIEYILKSKNENLLFKLWPQTPPLHNSPIGRRRFYPYGGLEEFIGQPTIETHIIFRHKILKPSGHYASVKVWANIHGNRIEKIITLRGDSTVLEVKYSFRTMDESLNIIGINPLIQIGPSTGPEDIYYFPVAGKMEERRPCLENYYGYLFHLNQGWVAGEDTKMNLSLAIAYPVDATLFMHYWSNHPNNTPTPYFYTELQPWIRIKHGTTTYFTYYLLGYDSNWKDAVQDLRDLGPCQVI